MPIFILNGQVKGKNTGLIDTYLANISKSLGINRMSSKFIEINFVTDQKGQLGNAWGCNKEGYAEINIARKCEGTKVKFTEMMQTLAHEMVHVKQYFRKELEDSGCKFKWKGRNADGYQYGNQPWELEAFKREEQLYNDCWPYELDY